MRVRPKTIIILYAEGKEVDVVHKCDGENYGPGKYFPGGLCCNPKDKKIPSISFMS